MIQNTTECVKFIRTAQQVKNSIGFCGEGKESIIEGQPCRDTNLYLTIKCLKTIFLKSFGQKYKYFVCFPPRTISLLSYNLAVQVKH